MSYLGEKTGNAIAKPNHGRYCLEKPVQIVCGATNVAKGQKSTVQL